MKPSIANVPLRRWLVGSSAIPIALVPPVSMTLSAQSPPPVQGTIALEGTMKKFYRAVNTIIVTTIDGVEHVYHFCITSRRISWFTAKRAVVWMRSKGCVRGGEK